MFCIAKYRGGVRRTEGLENTDRGDDRFRSPLPLLIVDEIGGSARRARELKKILAEKETEADINLSPAVSRSVTGSYVSNRGDTEDTVVSSERGWRCIKRKFPLMSS